MYQEYKEEVTKCNVCKHVHVSLADDCSLRGKEVSAPGGSRPVNAFLGIPFAQPPTEERRFQPPQPVQLWKGERDALKFGR